MSTAVKSWDRLEGEGDKQYAWFFEYLSLGPARTLATAHRGFYDKYVDENESVGKAKARKSRPYTGVSGGWKTAANKFDWVGRARDYDEERREQDLERDRQKWDERRDRIRDLYFDESMDQLKTAQKARTKADEVLLLPIVRQRTSADGSVVIMPLEDVTLGDASRLLNSSSSAMKNANEMARLACNLHVSKIALDIDQLDADEVIAQSIATLEALGYTVTAPASANTTP